MGTVFTNGTYNAVGLASWAVLNVPNNNYAYGANLFMQSGHVDGFALGGMLEVVNPFYSWLSLFVRVTFLMIYYLINKL